MDFHFITLVVWNVHHCVCMYMFAFPTFWLIFLSLSFYLLFRPPAEITNDNFVFNTQCIHSKQLAHQCSYAQTGILLNFLEIVSSDKMQVKLESSCSIHILLNLFIYLSVCRQSQGMRNIFGETKTQFDSSTLRFALLFGTKKGNNSTRKASEST